MLADAGGGSGTEIPLSTSELSKEREEIPTRMYNHESDLMHVCGPLHNTWVM